MSCCEVSADGGGGVASIPTWAQTLIAGRVSGGTSPQITDGDVLEFADPGLVVRTEMFWDDGAGIMTIRALNDGSPAVGGDNLEVLAGDGAGAGGVGGTLFLNGGGGGTTGAVGGDINILGGAGGSVSGGGGTINITSGVPVEGTGGQIVITASDGATTAAVANGGGAIALQCGNASAAGVGGSCTIDAGGGGLTGTAGTIDLRGGPGGATSGAGGAITLTGGVPIDGNGAGVSLLASAGVSAASNRNGGAITLTAGNAARAGTGGNANLTAGSGGLTGTAGTVTITSGAGGATSGAGGLATLQGGLPIDGAGGGVTILGRTGATTTATARAGGTVTITAGASVSGGTGGNVNITSGAGGGGGTPGSVVLTSPFNVNFESTFFTQFNPTSGSAEIIYGNDTCKLCVNSLSDINGLITATPGSEHIADNGAAANYRGLLYNKAGTGNTGWIPKSQPARVSTADATVTTVWAYTLVDNSAVKVKANLVAMQDTAANRKVFEINILVYRDGGGATVEGVVFDSFVPYGSAGFALATATLDVSGNDVRLRVTGIAATNIVWTAQMELDESR